MTSSKSVQRISSFSTFEKAIGYSRVVKDEHYVFVSGTTGFNYETMTIDSDVRSQTEQCFKNIAQALRQAHSSLDNVVRVRYIFTRQEYCEPCYDICLKFLGKAMPAATMIIAGLTDKRMKVEIEVTAKVVE